MLMSLAAVRIRLRFLPAFPGRNDLDVRSAFPMSLAKICFALLFMARPPL
jgi:hypothetical protein